jgi:oxygen-independent coproporphyrinogen-3 oxidase
MDALALPVTHPTSAQADQIAADPAPLGLYIHIPFCEKKCPYCDFNTYARLDHLQQPYVDALCREIRLWGERLGRPTLHTLFLGGGTPTVLAHSLLSQIVQAIHHAFELAPGHEFTSEANPGTVDQARFHHLHSLGINRLSMGVQSFDPAELAFLGRIHGPEDVLRAFDAARLAGFDNINLDFIFGLPEQEMRTWQATLGQIRTLQPEHVSLYSLIVEPNTPLHHWVASGQVAQPDEDQAAELYEEAMGWMGEMGYRHYEVSNWAKPRPWPTGDGEDAYTCQHNLLYWRNQEYIGVGPGAHSFLRWERLAGHPWLEGWPDTPGERGSSLAAGLRWGNQKPVPGYIKRLHAQERVDAFHEWIPPALSMGESMMLGLRLVEEGVALARFAQQHGQDLPQVYPELLARLAAQGLLRQEPDRVRLTPQGLMLANPICAAFLPE